MSEGGGEQKVIFHSDVETPQMLAEERYHQLVAMTLAEEGRSFTVIAFNFVSDDSLLEMNREHLDHDYYTDILTFPYRYEPVSADIYISVDRIRENAATNQTTVLDELHRVMIHGLLHMCGMQDSSEEEKRLMRMREMHHLEHWK